ncbi:PREDICTED: mavicyanin-like [Lupinus angustifolius]|uniref:mavicyanin-like n=1 Tax=Lupinus angustifolius TaxID=3871 RepID=UPI00092ED095|nr:PREDICTED: mavicyanin-like [Lupinus angustifolius]
MGRLVERVVIIMLMMMLGVHVSCAEVYKVGDSDGWTIIGNVDYKNWASTKNFQLGDTIIFEYGAQFHNVMRVTHAMYQSCNASSPITTFTSGNDSIKITNHGHHFFLCGIPGHCQMGQKVDINVLKVSAPAPEPQPPTTSPPSPIPSPLPLANIPAPTPSNAASFIALKQAFSIMPLLALNCFF